MKLVNRMNKRVKVYKESEEKNTFKETTGEPGLVAEIWAAIEPLQGNEYFSANAVQSEVNTRIRIRARKDLNRTMWVEHDGTEYEIKYIIHPKKANVEMQLMCRERQ